MMSAYLDNAIDYADRRPSVEVTIVILEFQNLDVASGLFDASFNVILDWEEMEFIEGIHYCQDVRSDQFVLSNWLKNDKNAFNPRIVIPNLVEARGFQEDPDNPIEPTIHRLVARNSGRDSVWLSKEYAFTGTLKARGIDARNYPFDIHQLPIEVKALPMPGMTTMGGERQVSLVDPFLRRMEAFEQSKNLKKVSPILRYDKFAHPPTSIKAHHWEMLLEASEVTSGQSKESQMPLKTVVGELQVIGYGGCDNNVDEYRLDIVVSRNWWAHFFDIAIQILLTVVSLCSVWVPFNTDTIANRLSISLAIILSIVFFVTERPAAIADVSYSTAHDKFEHVMMLASTLISFENVMIWLQCYGMDRTGVPDYFLYEISIFGMDMCSEGFLRSSLFDSLFFVIIVGWISMYFVQMVVKGGVYQLRVLASAMNDLNSYYPEVESAEEDEETMLQASFSAAGTMKSHTFMKAFNQASMKKVNRLGLNLRKQGKAEFDCRCSQLELVECLSRHGMPHLNLMPRFWLEMAQISSDESETGGCFRRRKEEAENSKGNASSSKLSDKTVEGGPSADWIKQFVGTRPVLSKDDQGFICDVGTGEIGFYHYCWRVPNGMEHEPDVKPLLFVECSKKMQMDTDKTFLESYCRGDGPARFCQALLDNFQLEGGLERMTSSLSAGSAGSRRNKKVKILIGPTGANRASALKDAQVGEALERFTEDVEQLLRGYVQGDVLLFIPSESDEATYELWATEWLVSQGDLSVENVAPGLNGVPFAGMELSQALTRAARMADQASSCHLQGFCREFEDLVGGQIDQSYLTSIFNQAAAAGDLGSDLAEISLISEVMRTSPATMRALIKNRLFNGTLSAGGGSCQITVKPEHSERKPKAKGGGDALLSQSATMRNSEFFSIPIGNKTPLTGDALFPRNEPMTRELILAWRARIRDQIEAAELPHKLEGNLRGVYIGISAVFYAADLAGCSQTLLPKGTFVAKLEQKIEALLANPPPPTEKDGKQVYDHRAFSNLTLVAEVVRRVMSDTAWIVCKRNWKAAPIVLTEGQELPKYVATWTLGFYLNQAA